MRPIFNVPGEGAFPFIMGIISGYPTGAKIVSNFKEQHICNKEEAERLIAFTNNSGPLFILGTVGISLFGDARIGYILLLSHIIACILVGVIFRNWKKNSIRSEIFKQKQKNENIMHLRDVGEVLGNSIKKSIGTILNIGGFIIVFSVILSILETGGVFEVLEKIGEIFNIPKEISTSIFSGIIELTNGVKNISMIKTTNLTICITSFLLGFGGISVLLQVWSIISKYNISIRPYFYGIMVKRRV